jgi:hypothetical protein
MATELGEISPNPNGYDTYPLEIISTFWIRDITHWWHQPEYMHSKYTGLSNVVRNIFTFIPHGVEVEARFSLEREVISWRH